MHDFFVDTDFLDQKPCASMAVHGPMRRVALVIQVDAPAEGNAGDRGAAIQAQIQLEIKWTPRSRIFMSLMEGRRRGVELIDTAIKAIQLM